MVISKSVAFEEKSFKKIERFWKKQGYKNRSQYFNAIIAADMEKAK